MHPVIKNCSRLLYLQQEINERHSKNTKSDCLPPWWNPSNWNNRQGKLKILGHFDKSSIQTIVLSLIQYKAHSVSSFICANRAGGGDRKHLIKSKLIFQQFELTELCYNGSRRRIAPESLTKRKMSSQCFTWRPWVLFSAFSYQSLFLSSNTSWGTGDWMKIPFIKNT